MKKNYFVLLSLFMGLFLSACSLKPNTESSQTNKKDIISNALTTGESLKCTFEQDGQTVTSYVKGNKSKIDGWNVTGGKEGGMVNDGEYVYIWDENKTGTKYKISVLEELNTPEPEASTTNEEIKNEAPQNFDFKEWMESREDAAKVDCKTVVLTDNDFVPPSDVTFKDITDTFIKMNEITKKMQANPDEIPSEEDMESLNQLMEDMGGTFGGGTEDVSEEE